MTEKFEMVAKTMGGLEEVLAEELRTLGAEQVEPGLRMVSFQGDLAMMYRANLACRTALSVLRPVYKFMASDPDELYDRAKEFDWGSVLSLEKTFSIDTVAHGTEFTHSHYVTYRVKDAIVDWFQDKYGEGKRPGVRIKDADVQVNVHVDGDRITLSLNSSGPSLHRRGWRLEQTEAPINEVLAAGIVLRTGYRGGVPFVDPMCGSGTFLVEAAMIAANIWPGSYGRKYAFQQWADYDEQLFQTVKAEGEALRREPEFMIYGRDMSPKAIEVSIKNTVNAGVREYVSLRKLRIQDWKRPNAVSYDGEGDHESEWDEVPDNGLPGILVTNPPYGERLRQPDVLMLYAALGTTLKKIFLGYHAWVISSNEEAMDEIGLAPSTKTPLDNGGLKCELREFVIFEGTRDEFRRGGGILKEQPQEPVERKRRLTDEEWRRDARKKGFGGKGHGSYRPDRPNRDRDSEHDRKRGRERDDERRGEGRKEFGRKEFEGRREFKGPRRNQEGTTVPMRGWKAGAKKDDKRTSPSRPGNVGSRHGVAAPTGDDKKPFKVWTPYKKKDRDDRGHDRRDDRRDFRRDDKRDETRREEPQEGIRSFEDKSKARRMIRNILKNPSKPSIGTPKVVMRGRKKDNKK